MPLRFLLTGAAGAAASGVRPLLAERGHEVVLLDVAPIGPDLGPRERVVIGSITDPATVDEALVGVDLVIALGGYAQERPWADISAVNIHGTQVLLDGARRAGVPRVLLASSTHTVGFWPVDTPTHELSPRPDTFYGVSKLAMEALGSLYADRYGMTVVAARIGTVEARPTGIRSLSTWLSFPDLVRLIEATATTDREGFHLVWAVSRNTRRWFPLDAGERLGFHPEDDAERYAAAIETGNAGGTEENDGIALIGGAFTDDDHPLGEHW